MSNQSIAILTDIAIQLVHKEREKGIFGLFYSTCRNLLNSVMNRDPHIDTGETGSRFVQKITAGCRPHLYPELVKFLHELNDKIREFGAIHCEDQDECVLIVFEEIPKPKGGLA